MGKFHVRIRMELLWFSQSIMVLVNCYRYILYYLKMICRFMKLVSDTSPLLEEIVSSPKGMQTVSGLWNDFMDLIRVIGGFMTKEETRKIG